MKTVIRHLRRAALLQEGSGLSDEQLLELFLAHRDEAALEVLMRHGITPIFTPRVFIPQVLIFLSLTIEAREFAIAASDLLIKGHKDGKIAFGNTLTDDRFAGQQFD